MSNPHSEQSPKELAEANQRQAKELSNAYTRLFGTPDGQIVFGDLNSKFLTNDVAAGGDHAYWTGAKSTMVYIIQRTQAGAK